MAEALVICAHPDDEIFGAGATIAKYEQEQKRVTTIVCSAGETSHPWLTYEYVVALRRKESEQAQRIVKTSKLVFLGLKDGSLAAELSKKRTRERLKKIFAEEKPKKIFTHAADDPHPDHHAVFTTVLSIANELNYRGSVYSFEIWNPINLKKREVPKLYVDVSKTFHLKVAALKQFRSQLGSLISLLPVVYLRALFAGLHAQCRYAEVFYKVR